MNCGCYCSFNSTLVQLKASTIKLIPSNLGVFQFYLSSIKSELPPTKCTSPSEFQFYLSSIKRKKSIVKELKKESFNSTLVQLKVVSK